jgi:hypothetical protein
MPLLSFDCYFLAAICTRTFASEGEHLPLAYGRDLIFLLLGVKQRYDPQDLFQFSHLGGLRIGTELSAGCQLNVRIRTLPSG